MKKGNELKKRDDKNLKRKKNKRKEKKKKKEKGFFSRESVLEALEARHQPSHRLHTHQKSFLQPSPKILMTYRMKCQLLFQQKKVSILSFIVLFCLILFCRISSYIILFCPISSYYLIVYHLILSYLILSHLV